MDHWQAALDRMKAYDKRMEPSHRGASGHKYNRSDKAGRRNGAGKRGIQTDAEDSGLEQYLFAYHVHGQNNQHFLFLLFDNQ